MDQALAREARGDAARRRAFVGRRYAWSAAADRYAEILTGLMGGEAAVGAPQPA
jgi:hypothetical protein